MPVTARRIAAACLAGIWFFPQARLAGGETEQHIIGGAFIKAALAKAVKKSDRLDLIAVC
jgi:hypothetical protein